ncbi:MAG: asparagine synthase (glutamine-hydrolyzing) [Nitrospirota bacterium]
MCGICGYFSREQGVIKEEVLHQMCEVIRHRGPDDEGIYLEKNVGLGMRRLNIIDLVSGHQPIHNEDQTIWVVYNGEIYNFQELRGNLEKNGHHFYTRTDTEVIVHLYEEMGPQCVTKLNGMFGFCLWDKRKNLLFLARDRLGIKPLHYTQVNNQFIFGSEIKSILVHPDVQREINLPSLSKYLTFEYIPAPSTIFKGIKKLSPGHIMTVNMEGQVKVEQYWDVSFRHDEKIKSEEEYSEELLSLLRASVKRRLISDVPLGVFLSGGIDSSTVTALMSELAPGQVKTFSIGFEDQSFDESGYARQVAQYFGTSHYEDILSPKKMIEIVPTIACVLDEPLGDASIIPTYLLSQFTRKYVTVALGGDGGDELFAGYPTYQAHRLAHLYEKIPQFIREGIIEKAINNLPVSTANISLDFQAKKFISGIPYPPEIRNYIWLGSFSPTEKKGLLSKEVCDILKDSDSFEDIKVSLAKSDARDFLDRLLYLDMKFYLQEDILAKVDRASMANSLEVRAPFLDYTFVEFVAKLPPHLKLKGLTTKYILKKAVKDILPKGIAGRKKKGFGIPVARWFKDELKEFVLDVFAEDKIKREGFFNYTCIKKLLEEHFEGKKDNRKQLWTLLIFELWYDKFMRGRK